MSSNSIFHTGDLQSGIAKAIQQSKAVVIFLRDDSSKSQEWAQDLFTRQTVSDILVPSSIVLQISKDTQEEAFLSAFCKVNEYPSLIVIKDGKLQAQLGPDLDVGELEVFFRNLKTQGTVKETPSTSAPASTPVSPESPPATTEPPSASASNYHDRLPAQSQTTSPTTTTSNAAPSTSSTPPKPSSSPSKNKGKARAASPPPSPSLPSTAPPPKSASQLDWVEKQRQRQIEAKKERSRIMAQIEADKASRRAEATRLKQERSAAVSPRPPSPQTHPRPSAAADTNLSIRLLDGSTLRHTLPSSASLDRDLRPWLAAAHPDLAALAYTFKHLLSPLPARAIEAADEHRPLAELGLAPSATLMLVRVQGGSDAYGAAGGGAGLLGLPWSIASAVGGVVGSVAAAAGGLLGYDGAGGSGSAEGGGAGAAGEGDGGESVRDGVERRRRGGGIGVRTLADQRAEGGRDESNRWYNGNQLSFQAKDDELEE